MSYSRNPLLNEVSKIPPNQNPTNPQNILQFSVPKGFSQLSLDGTFVCDLSRDAKNEATTGILR